MRLTSVVDLLRIALSKVGDADLPSPPSVTAQLPGDGFENCVQPDATTCGSATLVLARMMHDASYASFMSTGHDPDIGRHDGLTEGERFAQASLAMHERTSGFSQSGRLKLPWPKRLGTSPSGLLNEMNYGRSGVPATTYAMRWADPRDPGALYDAVFAAANTGHVVPIYVGNHLSPRHILLVIGNEGDDLTINNPANGETTTVTRSEWEGSNMGGKASWDEPWGAVIPR